MMKRTMHTLLGILVIILIASALSPFVLAEDKEEYAADCEINGSGYHTYDITIHDRNGKTEPVFCYRTDLGDEKVAQYPARDDTGNLVYGYTLVSPPESQMADYVRKVLWLAYPMDQGGYQSKFDLEPDQYRAITQLILWKYTEGTPGIIFDANEGTASPEKQEIANNVLAEVEKSTVTPPANFKILFYQNPYHQNPYPGGPTFEGDENTTFFQDLVWAKLLPLQVTFSKVAAGQSNELEGAQLILTYEDGTEVDKWTSTGSAKVLLLNVGVYTLTESQAPLGYDKAESITFRVTSDGSVEIKDGENWVLAEDATVQMTDSRTPVIPPTNHDVTFSKVAAGQTEELAGATLTVKRIEDDSTVETWTSTGTAKIIKLEAGEYILTEDQAPLGFETAESIIFRVNSNGSVEIKEGENWVPAEDATVQMTDSRTPVTPPTNHDVTFSKVAAGQTEELAGATLTVKRTDGSTIETWTSTGAAKTITLEAGEYILTEDQAPLGFETAENIIFRVNSNGSVEIKEGESWVPAANATVQMIDSRTPVIPPTNHDVTFSKVAAGQTEELAGATLTVKRIEDGSTVETWTSTGTAKIIRLEAGEYILTENQAPLGYEIAESIIFRVNSNGSVEIKDGDYWFGVAGARIQMVDKPMGPIETTAPHITFVPPNGETLPTTVTYITAPTPPSQITVNNIQANREISNQVVALPKTGEGQPVLSYLGFTLLALGAFLVRRRNKL